MASAHWRSGALSQSVSARPSGDCLRIDLKIVESGWDREIANCISRWPSCSWTVGAMIKFGRKVCVGC